MATRSTLVYVDPETNKVHAIYCHWDGYPEHHMPILREHYKDIEKIRKLFDLGDLSILAPEIGTTNDFENPTEEICLAYHRDRGEPYEDVKKRTYNTVLEALKTEQPTYGTEYGYVWEEDSGWVAFDLPSLRQVA